jgi:hypothetical protein
MYFQDFPDFLYDFEFTKGKREAVVITDITRNIRFRRDVLANISVYDEYDVMDGETPEIVAEKIYGNAEYHWIVMLANERYDYRKDWVLSTPRLEEYIQDKYGNNSDAIHHYEDAKGNIVYSTALGALSVSNRQYEQFENEKKRRIKLVSKQIIDTVLNNFKELL